MTTRTRVILLCAALAATVLCGERAQCAARPPIRAIDHACLPAGTSPAEIPLYRQDIEAQYVQIAYIDTYVCQDPDEASVQGMLKDLVAKARIAGADAVIKVKMLSNKREGFIENPRTPFRSLQQGKWEEHFFRGIAIKYTRTPKGEPLELDEAPKSQIDVNAERQKRVVPVDAEVLPEPVYPKVQAPGR